jgi:hypothetical protein
VDIAAQIKKIVLEIGGEPAREINGSRAFCLKIIPKIKQVLQAIVQNYSLPRADVLDEKT